MQRRDVIFLAALAAVAAAGGLWALAAQAPSRVRRIGGLVGVSQSDAAQRVAALRRRLNELGWFEGRNILLDLRYTNGDTRASQGLAKELVASRPDVILTSSTFETATVLRETRSIPIIFSTAADPVGSGFVRSLARPGGNVTGFTNNDPALADKSLELLKELAPRVGRVAVLFNPKTTANGGRFFLERLNASAPSLQVEIEPTLATDPAELDAAVAASAARPAEPGSTLGLLVLSDSFTFVHRARIVALAAQYRIPAIYPFRYFTDAGGLMSYGVDLEEPARQVADYVDLILHGADPAELPVQSPRKFELVINRDVAETLGLTVPPALLMRADKVTG
jgi:putative ABC transport system substrate-binding protein